jgi:hypothetical protein
MAGRLAARLQASRALFVSENNARKVGKPRKPEDERGDHAKLAECQPPAEASS